MRFSLFSNFLHTGNIKNALFYFHTFGIRSTIKQTLNTIKFTKNYQYWQDAHQLTAEELNNQRKTIFFFAPKISIIVPIYQTPELFLRQMITSILSQTYSNWELCLADGSDDAYSYSIKDIVAEYQQQHKNILYSILPKNYGISGNTNAAMSMATGEYIALLDHDDLLSPNALYEIVTALAQNPETDVIYTDEDQVDYELKLYSHPYFKPDFNLDLLRSCNYITHFYVVKKSLADQVGGFSDECNGSQDYDFILKTCELAKHIHHIPKILYHWRIHEASVAGNPEGKLYAYDSAVRALQNHLNRCQEPGKAAKDVSFGYYRITYTCPETPLVSIVTINCSKKFKEQLKAITTYSNYEIVDSFSKAAGQYFAVIYNGCRLLTPNWIELLLGNCCRKHTGIVSAKIFYKKGRVLEAGLLYTTDGQLHSPFYKFYDTDTGYCYRANIQQNCSVVSPYCFMIKREYLPPAIFQTELQNLPQAIYRLCDKLSQQKLSVVMAPCVSAVCKPYTRKLPVLKHLKGHPDPFYNPNFSEVKIYHLSKKRGS